MAASKPERDLILAILREKLPDLVQRYRVRSLGLFGSVAREQQGAASDVDLLVTFDQPPGLFRLIELENVLSDLLGCRVDLVLAEALRGAVRSFVERELVPV